MKFLSTVVNRPWNIKAICSTFLFLISFNTLGETFEQAYAPIAVGDITIFIPIERQPLVPPSLSIKADGADYLLEWRGDDATRFKLEYLVNGNWILVSDNILTTAYQVPISYGSTFRVSACDQYGCSDWRAVNNVISGELMINRFSKSSDAVQSGQNVALSWDVSAAVEVNIRSDRGHNYATYVGQGQQTFRVSQLTQFTLTTTSFGQSYSQSLIVSPTSITTNFSNAPEQDTYTQPLLDLVRIQNEHMLPVERALLSITLSNDTKLNIVPQQDNKLSRVTDGGDLLWTQVLNGFVANQPLFKPNPDGITGDLFITVSDADGAGQLCRISIDGSQLQCFDNKPGTQVKLVNMIAAPVLVGDRLFSVDADGNLYEVASSFAVDTFRSHGRIPLTAGDAILTSPVADPLRNSLILRTKHDNVIVLSIPSSPSMASQLFNQAKSLLGFKTITQSESRAKTVPLTSEDVVLTSQVADQLSNSLISSAKQEEIVLSISPPPSMTSQLFRQAKSFLGFETTTQADPSANLDVKWTKSLTQEEGK
jgi:hypothetical protein